MTGELAALYQAARRGRNGEPAVALEPVRGQLVVERLRRLDQVRQARRAPRPGSGRRARTRSTRSTDAYQCGAHTPSVSRRPGGQLSIASSNAMPSAAQSCGSIAGRVAEQVGRVDAPGRRGCGRSRPAAGSRGRARVGSPRTFAYEATTCAGSRIRNALVTRAQPAPADLAAAGGGPCASGSCTVLPAGSGRRSSSTTSDQRGRLAGQDLGPRPGWSRPVAAR